MIAGIAVAVIVVLLGGSLYSFLYHKTYQRSFFSLEIFYTLIFVYLAVLLGFGLLYFILSFQGLILVEGGELQKVGVLESMAQSLYFSGLTVMTVGYGDITPVGVGRFIALVQALIGYVLPTAFFMKIWQSSKVRETKSRDYYKQE